MIKSGVEKLKVKKKIPGLNSLEAAICNVALFKTMKEKDFKDSTINLLKRFLVYV